MDRLYLRERSVLDLPVLPFDEIGTDFPAADFEMLVVVTYQGVSNQWLLRDKSIQAKQRGYRLYSYVDPSASVDSTAALGENTIVCPHAIVEPFSRIGNGVIVRTGVYVGHDCEIGDYCFVAPRASLSGFARIKPHVFIGNSATVRDRITVGEEAVIGAGVTVLRDVPPRTIMKTPDNVIIPVRRSQIDI